MHLSTTLFSIAVLATSASATCFGSGPVWFAPYHVVKAYIETECRSGRFTGYINPGETRSACIQYGSGSKFDFIVQNLNQRDGFDLGDQDCIDRLYQEVTGCTRGGVSDTAGWRFTSDPNDGRC